MLQHIVVCDCHTCSYCSRFLQVNLKGLTRLQRNPSTNSTLRFNDLRNQVTSMNHHLERNSSNAAKDIDDLTKSRVTNDLGRIMDISL